MLHSIKVITSIVITDLFNYPERIGDRGDRGFGVRVYTYSFYPGFLEVKGV